MLIQFFKIFWDMLLCPNMFSVLEKFHTVFRPLYSLFCMIYFYPDFSLRVILDLLDRIIHYHLSLAFFLRTSVFAISFCSYLVLTSLFPSTIWFCSLGLYSELFEHCCNCSINSLFFYNFFQVAVIGVYNYKKTGWVIFRRNMLS